MESPMPTTYDSGVTSGTSTSKADVLFVKSLKGIFRLVEMIVSLIAFICVAVGKNGPGAGGAAGWCMFVTMFSFLVLTVTYFLWLFRVFTDLGNRAPIKFSEFVMYVVWLVFYFIAGCVAAAFGDRHAGMAAGAFFLFVLLLLFAVDTFFHYRYWQSSDEGPYICGHQVGGGGASSPSPAVPPTTADTRTPTY